MEGRLRQAESRDERRLIISDVQKAVSANFNDSN